MKRGKHAQKQPKKKPNLKVQAEEERKAPTLVVQPVGTLPVEQRVVPLGVTINKFGGGG